MNLFKRFHKNTISVKPEEYIETPAVGVPPMPKPVSESAKKSCSFCNKLNSQGRTGEISGTFLDGDPYTFEIMNQKGVDGRECYTLFIQNDKAVGFNEMPINNCPKCGRKLRARMRE